MQDPLNLGSRLGMDPPPALDARILGAACRKAEKITAHRRMHRALWWSGAAAAAMVAITGVWMNYEAPKPAAATLASAASETAKPRITGRELLELADWTGVEQENYNLSLTINAGAKESLEF